MRKLLLAAIPAAALIIACLLFPAGGAISGEALGENISLAFCLPFAGTLLCVAVMPAALPRFWEKWQAAVMAFWSLLLIVPLAGRYGMATMLQQVTEAVVGDYLTFIVLLLGLYCVAGNICLEGQLTGTPLNNTGLLLIGAVMASWIGTTGAAMVMIRPVLNANKWRGHTVQTVVFFIFLVANIGGALTPIGDPPLLMGFIRGVPFGWELQNMSLITGLNVLILLAVYYLLDRRAYRQDMAMGCIPPVREGNIRLLGWHNIIFLLMIVGAVILSGILPRLPLFQDAAGNAASLHIYGEVSLSWAVILEIAVILLAALLSWVTTPQRVRQKNQFNWEAMEEVAVLFIGIFITMIPALLYLKTHGSQLGLSAPWQMFWVTGLLSSFLDNTPTYLVFLATAGSLGATSGVATTAGAIGVRMLMAISCGAVFMGAATYIGNAPNFMVRSIAERNGVRMPSFFGYMRWSLLFLIPVFLLDTVLFFLG